MCSLVSPLSAVRAGTASVQVGVVQDPLLESGGAGSPGRRSLWLPVGVGVGGEFGGEPVVAGVAVVVVTAAGSTCSLQPGERRWKASSPNGPPPPTNPANAAGT